MALTKHPPAPAPWAKNFGEKKQCGEHAQPSLATRVGGRGEAACIPPRTYIIREGLFAQAQSTGTN